MRYVNDAYVRQPQEDLAEPFAIARSASLSPLSSTSARSMPSSFWRSSLGFPNSTWEGRESHTVLASREILQYGRHRGPSEVAVSVEAGTSVGVGTHDLVGIHDGL